MGLEAGDADADESQRPRPVASARSRRAQASSPIRSGRRCRPGGGRARSDGEVGIAELRRHGARRLAPPRRCSARPRHPGSSSFSRVGVADVLLERLLVQIEMRSTGSSGRGSMPAARSRRAPTLPGAARELGVAERGERADRLDAAARAGPRSAGRCRAAGGPRMERGTTPRGRVRTSVSPPGFRRSVAIFATTFELATPSAAVEAGAPADQVCTASARARASSKPAATSPRSR